MLSGKIINRLTDAMLQDSMEDIKKAKICKFIWSDRPGVYISSNNSFDGSMGLVAEGKADAFIRQIFLQKLNLRILKLSFFLIKIDQMNILMANLLILRIPFVLCFIIQYK